jgi:hypothetical protein
MSFLARWREALTLIFIALLPFHAMGVTVLTDALSGAGHRPLRLLAVWKEGFLALILLLAIIEILRDRSLVSEKRVWSLDLLDWSILAAVVLGAWVSLGSGTDFSFTLRALSEHDKRFLLGFKYDFVPLVAFFILRRVPWTRACLRSALSLLLVLGCVFAVFGLVTLFFPMSFFTALGYSDLHSLYIPHAPLAAFQMVEGTTLRRIQSVMSGPNQFGLWLLIPLAASVLHLASVVRARRWLALCIATLIPILLAIALFFTYSRSAWIGAFCMVALFGFVFLQQQVRSVLRRSVIIVSLGLFFAGMLFLGFRHSPQILLRSQSLIGHLEKPLAALQVIREHPGGLGIGTAGPASNHFSDTCVFFELGADTSWANKRTDICVFVGGVRKLPLGKSCSCPLLTENWYLQWGVEMGYAGLMLCMLIVLLPLFSARKIPVFSLRFFAPLALFGLGIGGLFLHSFEDAAVAYTIWIVLAIASLHLPQETFSSVELASDTLVA